jgi:hypothetical protein
LPPIALGGNGGFKPTDPIRGLDFEKKVIVEEVFNIFKLFGKM